MGRNHRVRGRVICALLGVGALAACSSLPAVSGDGRITDQGAQTDGPAAADGARGDGARRSDGATSDGPSGPTTDARLSRSDGPKIPTDFKPPPPPPLRDGGITKGDGRPNMLRDSGVKTDGGCKPKCTRPDGKPKVCGSNGCGGSCGSCAIDQTCGEDLLVTSQYGLCITIITCSAKNLPLEGCCYGERLYWCEPMIGKDGVPLDWGKLYRADCTASPKCGWNATKKYYDCNTAGAADPASLFPRDCTAGSFR
ncbi:MAG: hypothetical protein IT371_27765 [Deltaproteobacteria bacterium]|nr:hypothetical protein [Deltaproteobacteria bacterium]